MTPYGWNSDELLKLQEQIVGFCETVAAMRDPASGCAWMIAQDHASLARYVVEEAYEVVDAIHEGDTSKIADELGDLLLQVVLNGQIAKEKDSFSILDSIQAIDKKMKRRHPHVFNKSSKLSMDEVEDQYAKIKEAERLKAASISNKNHPFASLKDKKLLPAIQRALEIGKISKKIKFDWNRPAEVLAQLESEIHELREAFESEECLSSESSRSHLLEELGDVFFSWVQLTRHLDADPEIVALKSCQKFLHRFDKMREIAESEGIANFEDLSTDDLEVLWKRVKSQSKK